MRTFARKLFSVLHVLKGVRRYSVMNPTQPIEFKQLFINNEFVSSHNGKTFSILNPATEQELCQVSEADGVDVDLAVKAADKAFNRGSCWRTMDASKRAKILLKAFEIMMQRASVIANLETLNTGKPYSSALDDVEHAADCYRYYAGLADTLSGSTISPDGEFFAYTRPEPIGVCGQIIPWNYPASLFAWKVAPALACGNVLIVKPSELTPLSALYQAQVFKEAGLPPGVLNIVPGFGPVAGSALVRHPRVRKIAFTGSTMTGKIITRESADNMKKLSMELGGKSPYVVFPDADLDAAAQGCHAAIMDNSGQNCCAGSRNYVHEKVYDAFVEKAVKLAQARVIGDPWNDKSESGSLISNQQMTTVLSYVEAGRAEGAKLEVGGHRIGSTGYFVEPTVFSNVTDDMKIAREEIFGPVQTILKFSDTEDVIDRCNDSEYGLGAGVYTRDYDTAMYLSHNLKGGITWVNCADSVAVQTPFGGFKQSGFGKELGTEAMRNYYELKTVMMSMKKKNS